MGKVGNVVTLCVLWYTSCCTHKPRPQQDYNDQAHDVCYANPNSHRRTVNNYLLYNIGVNIPYTVAFKPSHLLAAKVTSPSACKQKHTSVYKFFPRIWAPPSKCIEKNSLFRSAPSIPVKSPLGYKPLHLKQEHPTIIFCKISVWRGKNCLEFSIAAGRLKISRWQFSNLI